MPSKLLHLAYKSFPVQSEAAPQQFYSKINFENSFLLETSMQSKKIGRYSVFGANPSVVFVSRMAGRYSINGKKSNGDALHALKNLVDGHKLKSSRKNFFLPGFYGYFSYDLNASFERIPRGQKDILAVPEIYFMFFPVIAVFDIEKNKIEIFAAAQTKKSAEKLVPQFAKRLFSGKSPLRTKQNPARAISTKISSNFSKSNFIRAVKKTKEYIFAGDIFQANISQMLSVKLNCAPFELYNRLMVANPAPFSAFLNLRGFQIISSSPELLLKIDGRKISTRPIAGTRPRGKTVVQDKMLEHELRKSEKELAEHSMLVDLERNDLGKISAPGSVKINELFTIERYARVMHLVSEISGTLAKGKGSFDAIRALFPGGTITGCPKVRSMEIIRELEPTKRGPYTGSIGYIGIDGNVELNIAIRTMVSKVGRVFFSAGAGIVADSVPQKEFTETMHKARAMIDALNLVHKPRGGVAK